MSSPEILKQHLEAAKGVRAVIRGYTMAFPRPLLVTTRPEQDADSTLTNKAKAIVIVPPCRGMLDGDGPISNDDEIEILSNEDEVAM